MNKRLICAEDAIEALKKAYWDKNIQSAKDDPCIVDAMTDWAIRQIKELPSAQPENIARDIATIIENEKDMRVMLKNAQPQLDAEFAEAVRAMFADIWDREIDHPRFQDTVGEILEKVIELHNSVPPMKLDEWCESCKEYDQTTHSCPRFNRVIRNTIDDVRKEAYKHGKSKGIKRGMAMAQRWIPFSQHKPKTGQQILACSDDGVMWMTAFHPFNNFTGAWMPLPEPYKGEQE